MKRLEMQKARYQAAQVKETRQVVVNRSPGNTSGGGSGSTSGGKQVGAKGNSAGSGSGAQKNSSGGALKGSTGGGQRTGSGGGTGSSGSSGSKGTGPGSGSGAGGRGTSGSGKPTGPKQSPVGQGQKDSGTGGRSNAGGPGKDRKSSSAGNTGSTGGRGSDGKQGKDGQRGKSTGSSGKTAGEKPRNDRPWKNRTATGDTNDKKTRDGGSPKNAPEPTNGAKGADPKQSGPKTSDAKGSGPKTGAAKTGESDASAPPADLSKKPGTPDTGKTGQDPAKPSTPTNPATTPKKTPPAPATDPGTTGSGKPLDVRASREAGYRDGVRTGRVIAHMGAYRDGARDGYRDTHEAAERQRQRLDQAHDTRKKQRHTDTKGGPEVSAKTSADHHPQPVPVHQVTATHVTFGDGQSRTRGEVRTLKQYERRLEEKADGMHRIADATKKLQAHAEEQAKTATGLLEQAKAIKGGEKVTSVLSRLVDKATNQARLAGNLQQRALRAAENTTVILANTQTRYGSIYKAVVDSPETKPAELRFYRDGGTSNA
ncbi:hypothetical protein [Streptomyces caniscabiei]|uniref:Uncharacterized protein n=1 Tax=Streptomyces caniscabiei TaxID=2746961 RepID=A0ABU4MYW7_9ACTN|nr:hypothetical protein [Streptomyces caniscabiei]MBE4799530.1 hypothetical protein [Streptomyces caniscabiei]MDX3015225.1 hypothetical protein [Streptomyces caniscabiei]MDX3042540.1 hypothetical protein [Streptomyces caniscabiei]